MKLQFRLGRFSDHEFIKFLTVGVLNTIFGYTVYAALLSVGTPYLFALLLATFVGVVFNYFSIGRIVFREQGGWLIFCQFVIAYAVIYTINAVVLSALTRYSLIGPYVGQMICIPVNVLLSWSLMNYWVFKR